MKPTIPLLAAALFLAGCGSVVHPAAASPDRKAYATLLARHVSDEGLVDYADLAAHRGTLRAAYAEVARRSPASHPADFPERSDALAYWIDAYNLAVLVGVVELGVEDSVQDVSSPFPLGIVAPAGAGFFYFVDYEFGGEEISLYDLEHDVIREGFGEPRIHFAINCASAGCPRLQNRPFAGDDLDARLDAATREFVAGERGVRIDEAARTVRLSPIFDWFAEDFGELLPFLIRYAVGERKALLQRARDEEWEVSFFEYDWSLNGRR